MKKENITQVNENNQPHGYWETYWSNGNLDYKGNYVDGKKHGYWEEYYSNGNLGYKGNYVDGKKHGYWEVYYYHGDLEEINFYI